MKYITISFLILAFLLGYYAGRSSINKLDCWVEFGDEAIDK